MYTKRAEAFFPPRTTTSRRIFDVRAADLQEEMAEQRFFLPDPTKAAATREHRSERNEQ
jgi:hypothetical protein